MRCVCVYVAMACCVCYGLMFMSSLGSTLRMKFPKQRENKGIAIIWKSEKKMLDQNPAFNLIFYGIITGGWGLYILEHVMYTRNKV